MISRRLLVWGAAGLVACGSLGIGCRPQGADAPRSNAVTRLSWGELPALANQAVRAPARLKADDGSELRLRSVAVRALVLPLAAYTELELEFAAIPAHSQGATCSVELPPSAAVSRFAVQSPNGLEDAVIVDSAQARLALSSGAQPPSASDPSEPHRFSARLLNQPGRAPRLLLAYAERLLPTRVPYRIPLAGLPKLDSVRVTVDVAAPHALRYQLARANFTPDRDFALTAEQLGTGAETVAFRAGKYLVARIAPETTPSSELTFMVDTSASEPAPLERISDRLLAISAALAKQEPDLLISVLGFDQELHPVLVHSRVPLSAAQLAPLRELGRLGGTDLVYAGLAPIEQRLPREHLVMLSDLENTMAPVSNAALPRESQPRSDLLALNAAAETTLREKLKRAGGLDDFPGVIARLDDDPTQIAARLLTPTPSKTTLRVDGASWVSPHQSEYVRESEITPRIGDAVWVLAESAEKQPIKLTVHGKALANLQTSADPAVMALLAHLVGQAQLDQLLAGGGSAYLDEDTAPAVPDQLTRISKAYGLVPEQSSILVGAHPAHSAALAGRVVEPLAAPRAIMTVERPPDAATTVANEKCPDLLGFNKQRAPEQSCPPLYVSFSAPEPRLIAEVQFGKGSSQPNVAASPHLPQLADLLTLRPELAQLSVKASSTARAEGVIRYLVRRGISLARLHAAQWDAPAAPVRRPTPSCKSPGETVVLEVRAMSAAPLSPPLVKKPISTFNASPSRLASIDQLIRSAQLKSDKPALTRARTLSERWLAEAPASPLPYIALGNSLMALQDARGAARAYGSLFDLTAPGAGLAMAAAARLQQLAPDRLAMGHYNDGNGALEQRWRELAAATWGASERDPHEGLEASRASGYAALRAKRSREAFYELLGAAARSPLSARLELPVFAQFYAAEMRDAPSLLESFLPRDCAFPLQASVRGAFLSWEDVESELEVSVTSLPGGYSYDSVLAEHGAGGGLKWIPLPEDDASYPIRVSVRAERLSKNGYAFGILRTLDSPGSGRARSEERPFVATQIGEPLTVLEEQILQRPQ